jgi:hypothetical protein
MGIAKTFHKKAVHVPEVPKKQKAWAAHDAAIVPFCTTETGATKQKILAEACQLKLAIQKSHKKTTRFSFSTMKRVVVPPVKIPSELTHWTITETRVGGKEIPMTMRQHSLKKYHMSKRVPACIDEEGRDDL